MTFMNLEFQRKSINLLYEISMEQKIRLIGTFMRKIKEFKLKYK